LRGLSERRYRQTVMDTACAFGVPPSSVSGHIVEVTAKKLRDFKARDLSGLYVFALYIDTVHRAGEAFFVAMGIDREGRKHALSFWQGATENHEICEELFVDMERRGLILSRKILFVTDGGSGIIKALKDRFGQKLLHQRCTIHKDRNIQRRLPKKYRKEAHRKFTIALEQEIYDDARQMLQDFEKWLKSINESAADSLLEATERYRHKLMNLIPKYLPLDDLYPITTSNLPDQIPYSVRHIATQNRFPILGNPHQMQVDHEYRMGTMPILCHNIGTLPKQS